MLSSYSGNVYSTGYPNAYADNLNCEWQIFSPSKDQTLEIEFKDVNVFSGSDSCLEDERIEVYSGTESDPKEQLLDIICGSSRLTPPTTIKSKYGKRALATLVFRTGHRLIRFKNLLSKAFRKNLYRILIEGLDRILLLIHGTDFGFIIRFDIMESRIFNLPKISE